MKKLYYPCQIKEAFEKIKQKIYYTQQNQKLRTYYTNLRMGFDIETTTLSNHNAYMYVWQFSINEFIFIGRTWDEFNKFLEDLELLIIDNKYSKSKKCKAIIWVANLGFEFQFIRKRLKISKLFAKREREPLYFTANDVFEFRDCLAISGGSLETLANTFTKTKKLSGDLDYKKIRNNKTPLTLKETKYIINDVKILSEWAEYIFENYVRYKHQLPLTKTGIIRNRIKSNIDDTVYKKVKYLFPNEESYDFLMKYLFRGGYTHANAYLTDLTLNNVFGIDFKSSYPYVMTHFKYPMSVFKQVKNPSFVTIEKFNDRNKYAYIVILELYDVNSITNHSIESKNKCIKLSDDAFIDNGRVRKCSHMRVCLTNYDYEIYKKFYTWSNESKVIQFTWCYVSPLPNYLLNELHGCYLKKEELKSKGLDDSVEYKLAKSDTNSNYGMCVTRIKSDKITYINNEWSRENGKPYLKLIEKQFLSPFWGIWITSIARWNLLRFLSLDKIGNDGIYSDTDSIYSLHYEKYKNVIDEYNKEIINKNKEYFSTRVENPEYFYKLGCFELDPINTKFKTLGAKRYIKTYFDSEKNKEVTKVTIAGLPKKALLKYCENENIDIYEYFQNDMSLDIEVSLKNAHTYNDNEHCDYVDGILMHEYSSCGIYQTTFKLTLAEVYLKYLEECERKRNDGIY